MLNIFFYVLHSSPIFIMLICRTFSNKHAFISSVEKSVDPDQLASEKPADLDLHCFQNRIYRGSAC